MKAKEGQASYSEGQRRPSFDQSVKRTFATFFGFIEKLSSLTLLHRFVLRSFPLRPAALLCAGHGVFDGNVQVNKLAQQTDANQLSRNLLLAPRATVNIKPNLQVSRRTRFRSLLIYLE